MFLSPMSNKPQINGETVKVKKRTFSLTWISKQYNYASLHGSELQELPHTPKVFVADVVTGCWTRQFDPCLLLFPKSPKVLNHFVLCRVRWRSSHFRCLFVHSWTRWKLWCLIYVTTVLITLLCRYEFIMILLHSVLQESARLILLI